MRSADDFHFSFGDSTAGALVDGAGTIVAWTAEAEALLQRTAHEVCGRPVRTLLADPGQWPEVVAQRTGPAWEGRA
ncbi:MAG: hypothetical protein ACRDOV_14505, partial [Streptomyces sp.]